MSLLLATALGGAAPAQATTGQPGTKATHTAPSKRKAKRVRTPKPPTTTATGTTTPKPSDPAGTVPPGAPGTSDPTLPGSPPK